VVYAETVRRAACIMRKMCFGGEARALPRFKLSREHVYGHASLGQRWYDDRPRPPRRVRTGGELTKNRSSENVTDTRINYVETNAFLVFLLSRRRRRHLDATSIIYRTVTAIYRRFALTVYHSHVARRRYQFSRLSQIASRRLRTENEQTPLRTSREND